MKLERTDVTSKYDGSDLAMTLVQFCVALHFAAHFEVDMQKIAREKGEHMLCLGMHYS